MIHLRAELAFLILLLLKLSGAEGACLTGANTSAGALAGCWPAPCAGLASVHGVVRDATGGVVAGARVALRNAQHTVVGSAVTDEEGRFQIAGVPPGNYQMVVSAQGFAELRAAVRVASTGSVRIDPTLELGPRTEKITVTAEAGVVEERRTSIQPVNVIGQEQVAGRAKAVLAQALVEEAGLHPQRTSPTIGGVFIRGLTGSRVNVFLDGVRYSTSAARGGIHTFLNLVDPTHLGSIEVLRGPRSADYGSDALGGSLQLLTVLPALATAGPEFRGSWATFFNSADRSFGSNLATSLAARSFGLASNLVGRRVNTLRTGGGLDSRSAVVRFLGLPSAVLAGDRLPDTAFTQYGGLLNVTWKPLPTHSLSLHYQRGQQDGGKRHDQLLGGDGNLVADLRNLMLDFLYVRYDKQALGWLDNVTLTYSFNTQREERVNQGGQGNPRSAVVHEYERTGAHGLQVRADRFWRAHQLRGGGEVYLEGVRAQGYALDPAATALSLRRPRIPDRARYRSWGLYLQDLVQPIGNRLKLVGALRYSGASYRVRREDAPVVSGRPLWPGDALRVDDISGRAGALVTLGSGLSFSFHFSRGFRAPHVTDLGTLGLTGAGFEVAAPDTLSPGGRIGSTADGSAVSTGRPVTQVKPESSLNYDFSLRYYRGPWKAELGGFVNRIGDVITKQTLILPPGAAGRTLGGEPIVAQNSNGAVFVAASSRPVLARANFGDARIWGLEQNLEMAITRKLTLGALFTYLRAADPRTGQPPNLEGGTPAPDGWLRLRFISGRGFWMEPYLHAAARQGRLSSLDLEDRRIGAMRSRSSIADFFLNGATVRGLVGTDGLLLATRETLAEVQDRVLGPGVFQAPLFRALPGYVTVNLRAGFGLGKDQQVTIDLENLTDRNYRGISWGMDAPGRSLYVRYQHRF